MASILVVDDEPAVRDILNRRLTEWGHHVVAARTADEAVALMEASPAPIVFCDLIMPGSGGIWLMQRIHERWPKTIIVVISGAEDMDKVTQARKLGAVDFVAKPIGREMLHQALARALAACESRH